MGGDLFPLSEGDVFNSNWKKFHYQFISMQRVIKEKELKIYFDLGILQMFSNFIPVLTLYKTDPGVLCLLRTHPQFLV